MNRPFRPSLSPRSPSLGRLEVRCGAKDASSKPCRQLLATLRPTPAADDTEAVGEQRGGRTVVVPAGFEGDVQLAPLCTRHNKHSKDNRWRVTAWLVPAVRFQEAVREASRTNGYGEVLWTPWDDGNRPAYDAE